MSILRATDFPEEGLGTDYQKGVWTDNSLQDVFSVTFVTLGGPLGVLKRGAK
jgi:hypothetical protein